MKMLTSWFKYNKGPHCMLPFPQVSLRALLWCADLPLLPSPNNSLNVPMVFILPDSRNAAQRLKLLMRENSLLELTPHFLPGSDWTLPNSAISCAFQKPTSGVLWQQDHREPSLERKCNAVPGDHREDVCPRRERAVSNKGMNKVSDRLQTRISRKVRDAARAADGLTCLKRERIKQMLACQWKHESDTSTKI